MKKEIAISDLQRIVTRKWTAGVLSGWIDIVKTEYPDAEIINYIGATEGRINGVLYEFYEKRMYNDAPYIIRSYHQKTS